MTNVSTPPEIPGYTVKVSTRAKHVRLKISPADGLVVVVPKRFDQTLLDDIVMRHASWIDRTFKRYPQQENMARTHSGHVLPSKIELPALGEQWVLEYVETQSDSVRITRAGSNQLRVSGKLSDSHACHKALRRWLMRHAKEKIIPVFDKVSDECRLGYSRVTIRGQRTRWGSCSSTGSINLNFQLMFVSPAMLRYVLVHELCHTIHLNHSRAFYALLAGHEPEYKMLESQLRRAWQTMPAWLNTLQAA